MSKFPKYAHFGSSRILTEIIQLTLHLGNVVGDDIQLGMNLSELELSFNVEAYIFRSGARIESHLHFLSH